MNFEQVLNGIEEHQWTSERELGEFLASLMKMINAKNVLESGVFKGQTSVYLINVLPDDGEYIGLDIEDLRSESVKQYMDEDDRSSLILGTSLETMKTLPTNYFDLIFLDSVHTEEYLRREFKLAEKLIRRGGYIVIHNLWLNGVTNWVNYISSLGWFDVIRFDDTCKKNDLHQGFAIIKCLFNYQFKPKHY